MGYDATEQDVVAQVFADLLRDATKDGGKKREAGLKPPWWKDESHQAAVHSHEAKWLRGELKDADSGAHPKIHQAWRDLAIAYQETYGKRDPRETGRWGHLATTTTADEVHTTVVTDSPSASDIVFTVPGAGSSDSTVVRPGYWDRGQTWNSSEPWERSFAETGYTFADDLGRTVEEPDCE